MLPYRLPKLRRIQFTTVLGCYNQWDLPPGVPADYWNIPDDSRQWPAACEVLASLQHLQYARVAIFSMCQLERHRHATKTELLYEILRPLKAVYASEFTVEVAMPLQTVRERLGTTPFRLLEREYPVCSSLLLITISADSLAETAILTALATIYPSIAQGGLQVPGVVRVKVGQCEIGGKTVAEGTVSWLPSLLMNENQMKIL